MAQAIATTTNEAPLVTLRVPPHSIEAEQSVLGGLLLDNQGWDRIADIITAEIGRAHV